MKRKLLLLIVLILVFVFVLRLNLSFAKECSDEVSNPSDQWYVVCIDRETPVRCENTDSPLYRIGDLMPGRWDLEVKQHVWVNEGTFCDQAVFEVKVPDDSSWKKFGLRTGDVIVTAWKFSMYCKGDFIFNMQSVIKNLTDGFDAEIEVFRPAENRLIKYTADPRQFGRRKYVERSGGKYEWLTPDGELQLPNGGLQLPTQQEPQIPEIPRPPYQIGMCSLVVINQTQISWDVEVNGSRIGTLNSWSQMEAPCACEAVMLKLYGTGFNFSRSLSKAFYPNERSGNRFIYRIRLGN